MISASLERAIQDFKSNLFLHVVTMVTIALSVLIVSTFVLFLTNARTLMASWKQGVRVIVYVEDNLRQVEIEQMAAGFKQIAGVTGVEFISKESALAQLKTRMAGQQSLLENLDKNPLPDAFEVRIDPSRQSWRDIEMLVVRIASNPLVSDVEYGKNWLKRFAGLLTLFRLTGIMMCVVFFMASVFIVANTIRLLFYSKSEELKIMRLVGATDQFIKIPYYIAGLIQGALGGITGLIILYLTFILLASSVDLSFTSYFFTPRFISIGASLMIILGSMLAGWLGCYISLKQFLID